MSKKILVVDDETEIARILEVFLTKKGFEVFVYSYPEKAIEFIKSEVLIDLLITDMKMPKVRGIDILKILKQERGNVPIIILTGSIDAQKYKKPLEELNYSAEDIVYKPIDLNELLTKVEEKIGKN